MALTFVALVALSWRKWPDPLIDFGQQLYIPWRLSHGAILYQDIMYLHGCLSVCYHALLFKLFGTSLNVILASNFLILIFLLLLVYRLFLKSADAWTATTAGLALMVLAFGQFLDVGNYNYICPYSHEALHGIVLAVVMIASLSKWLQTGQKLPMVAAGACLGLVWLTKPEIFVGAAVPFAFGFGLRWRQVPFVELARSLLLALFSSLIPLAGFFIYFRSETNVTDSFRALMGAWLPVLDSPSLHNSYYQKVMGLDAPWFHIGQALIEFGGLAAIVGLFAWRLTRPALKALECVIIFAMAGGVSINYNWQSSGHALPLLLLATAFLWWREWRRNSEFRIQNSEFGIMWLAFSFAMLAKMGFNPRISHYGVFLAMPAFLSAIYLLLHLLPRFLERFGLATKTFRVAILILLLAGLARLTIQSALFYKDKDFTLGSGSDRIVTYNPKIDPTGADMASAVGWIETHTAPTNTLAVLPEGVMLNYLMRRDNPTPYVVFAFEVWAFGEHNMLAAYEKNPPVYIVLIQRDSSEYGVPYFGLQKGYGFDMMQWVRRNYQPVELIGSEPLRSGAFGIEILKRLPLGAPAKQKMD